MPKMNQLEYEVLKELDDKWKWLARDSEYSLDAYTGKPAKEFSWGFWNNTDGENKNIYNGFKSSDELLFQFIQWEDEKPYNVAELIEEYEKQNEPSFTIQDRLTPMLESLFNESEGTEVKKDLEWVKYQIARALPIELKGVKEKHSEDLALADWIYNVIEDLIDQLDEPETLSQDWIDWHKITVKDVWSGKTHIVVPTKELQNLLVPKQEETNDDLYILKVGGGYMTDFELTGGRVSAFSRGSEYGADVVMASKPFMEFVQKQVGGELYNITNPEEQKYYVLNKKKNPIIKKGNTDFVHVANYTDWARANDPVSAKGYSKTLSDYQFTEQEIKDYDERYFPFAVKVEELEE